MAEDLAKIAANLEKSGQPLWLWEPKRRRIIWANGAGREFWGSQSLFDLAARSFAPQGPEARTMALTGSNIETSLNLPWRQRTVRGNLLRDILRHFDP